MDLVQFSYLVAIADAGSFSRAATTLGLAQPSLSRQIGLLEQELHQKLLVRTGRGVQPTEAGSLLIGHARAMLASSRQIREDLRDLEGSPSGRVVVGMPPRVALTMAVPLIRTFREQFPRATITVIEGLSLSLREQLIAGRLDVALLFDAMPAPQLILEALRRERMLLVGPPGAEIGGVIRFGDLPRFPMVLPSAPNAIRAQVDAALLPEGLELQVVAEVGAVQTAVALVAAGVGYTILPKSALDISKEGRLLPCAEIAPELWNSLMLAEPKRAPSSRLARATTGLLKTIALVPALL